MILPSNKKFRNNPGKKSSKYLHNYHLHVWQCFAANQICTMFPILPPIIFNAHYDLSIVGSQYMESISPFKNKLWKVCKIEILS